MIISDLIWASVFSLKDDIFALYGWKALYGDVFRPPEKPMLLCAVLGSGCQITLTIFGTLGIKPQPNDRNISTQHIATFLAVYS